MMFIVVDNWEKSSNAEFLFVWVSKPEWAALFILGRGVCIAHSRRFTSGATPADPLVASMVAKPFSSTYLAMGRGGLLETGTYHAITSARSTEMLKYNCR